jgi:hypothetical protein
MGREKERDRTQRLIKIHRRRQLLGLTTISKARNKLANYTHQSKTERASLEENPPCSATTPLQFPSRL